jgi:segregation and condensation protein A
MHQIHLEQFEGPLDLLLQLIEKDKLQITEISLAKITDQYLAYLEKSQNLAMEEVADFLLIASKLIYLKSKYLLPDLSLPEVEDALDLEKQLKIYRQYYEASKLINKMFLNKKRYSYVRTAPYKLEVLQSFFPPRNVSQTSLREIFAEILSRVSRVINLPKVIMARAISIGEKIDYIKKLIREKANFTFNHLLKEKKNKIEAVVTFLAILELVKQKEIVVEQSCLFGELNINKNGK